ncbi:MAG: hypothetical protein JW768_12125 [Chitinispirillaceae bacterium]|nr:hypothetical protein [Chitinispirillaceae bacterium]
MASDQVHETILGAYIRSGRDTRYRLEAYLFVINGLEFYLTVIGEKRHVTGQELAVGLLRYAAKQFGPLALSVLNQWGIATTGDLGNIVYNLIDIKVMSKQPHDRREDFDDVVDVPVFLAAQDPYEIDGDFIKSIKGA